ncbi:Bis(5'-nucleosyl)-tetraphosphatase, symmetrical [hydrothermal vent metagenome]|uniref:bis(5'-nucleosyl)-tetraphosphatase (symmetrical) n=1 Tax=hydrothermal vent metagenome TaxID=652676 RepID=A0A3B1A5D7_9ZZZZ
MAVYSIGDVQGCYDDLCRLLDLIAFDPAQDQLWFAGDLVNRGPQSVEVLRFVKDLGAHAVTVLGNHDLHLLAVAYGESKQRKHDTFADVLHADDRDELLTWLRHQPLAHYSDERDVLMVHAGVAPQWTLAQLLSYAAEVETALRGDDYITFFNHMYGDQPEMWNENLQSWPRLRFITNTVTRLRYCERQGRQALSEKGPLGSQAEGLMPWYDVPDRNCRDHTILFGHWAALGAGQQQQNVFSLDSGCAWGGTITALCLDSFEYHSTPCLMVSRDC